MYNSDKLEIHVADHCNLDCVGCSHESPLMNQRLEEKEKLRRSLEKLWEHYQAPQVTLLGGEPLLHPQIDSIVSMVKDVTDAHVRLRTNGTMIDSRSDQLSGIDDVYISVYPEADLPDNNTIRSIAVETNTPIVLHNISHFRWEHVLPRDDEELSDRIFNTCKLYHEWKCHTLRDGVFYPCPPTATWAEDNEEGIDLLADHADLHSDIGDLLERKEPFETCSECLGSAGKLLEHELGWRETREEPPDQPVDYEYLAKLERDPNAYNGCHEYDWMFHPDGDVESLDDDHVEKVA